MLNKDSIMYYSFEGPVLRPGSSLFSFMDFDKEDYWYVDFQHGWDLEDVKLYMPLDIMDRIRNGEVTLLLNNSHEAFHDPIEYIYQYFVTDMKFPPKQIRLLSESATIDKEIVKVAEKYNADTIRADWLRMFEYNVSKITTRDNDYDRLNTLEHKHYDKKYLNLNRRWRPHRPLLVGLLKVFNLLDKGHVSFALNVDGQIWDGVWGYIERNTELHGSEFHTLITENKDLMESMPSMYLDTEELHINQVQVTDDLDHFYLNSYFSVVNETNYFKDIGEGIFLSEKVFKPVLKNHPFILVSRPHSLVKFRELGYKSFAPIIDESYDSEEDDAKRIMMILNEIKRLSNLSDDELKHFLTEAKKICDHNFNRLARKKFREDDYVTPLI